MYINGSVGGNADLYTGAWYGNSDLKAEVMQRLYKHREEDEIIQGVYQQIRYWEPRIQGWAPEKNYKGCALGCTLPLQSTDQVELSGTVDWHERIERAYNIPAQVAAQIDDLFEGQHGFKDAADFAVASIEAIAVGADLRGLAADAQTHHDALDGDDYGWVAHEHLDCWVCRGVPGEFLHLLEKAPVALGARALILVG